jgi:hypothetical protein
MKKTMFWMALAITAVESLPVNAAENCKLKEPRQMRPAGEHRVLPSDTPADNTCSAAAGPLAYVMEVDSEFRPSFGLMDIGMGKFYPIATLSTDMVALAGSSPTALYAVDVAARIYSVNAVTGKTTLIGPTGITTPGLPGYNVDVLATTADGTLYAMNLNNTLYRLDTKTGAATLIGSTGIPALNSTGTFPTSFAGDCQYLYFTVEELDFSSNVTSGPLLYRIDPGTAASTAIGPVPDFIVGSGFVNGQLYAFTYDYSGQNGPKGFLLDPATGAATPVSRPLNVGGFYSATGLAQGGQNACTH